MNGWYPEKLDEFSSRKNNLIKLAWDKCDGFTISPAINYINMCLEITLEIQQTTNTKLIHMQNEFDWSAYVRLVGEIKWTDRGFLV